MKTLSEKEFRALDSYNQQKWLYENILKMTLDDFGDYLDYYYTEREWNQNCE